MTVRSVSHATSSKVRSTGRASTSSAETTNRTGFKNETSTKSTSTPHTTTTSRKPGPPITQRGFKLMAAVGCATVTAVAAAVGAFSVLGGCALATIGLCIDTIVN